jgi:hypothetical protein
MLRVFAVAFFAGIFLNAAILQIEDQLKSVKVDLPTAETGTILFIRPESDVFRPTGGGHGCNRDGKE